MPPMGGFFLGDATPCLSRGSSSGDICSSPLTRSSRGSLPAPGRPKRQFSMPAISPFGLPSSGPASEVRRRKSEQHLSSVGGESQWSVRTAAAGGVCSLDVEHSGAYGVFCAVFRCQAMLTSAQCFMPSMRRWRWAQLYRASARAPPRFEVLRSKPSSAAAKDLVMLESVPLQLLHRVLIHGTTSLLLSFREQAFSENDQSDLDAPSNGTVTYCISFECPSHLFRWRLVLEAWSSVHLPELPPIVTMDFGQGVVSSNVFPASHEWDGLLEQLDRETLQRRLGGLWRNVRIRLGGGRTSC